MMELNMAMGKGKKHKASRKHKMVKELNTDRDIFKGNFTNEFGENKHNFHTEKLKQEEEFEKIVYTTTFKFQEDDERFDETSNKGTSANKFEEQPCEIISDKFKQDVDIKGM